MEKWSWIDRIGLFVLEMLALAILAGSVIIVIVASIVHFVGG